MNFDLNLLALFKNFSRPHPARDWLIVVGIGAVLFVVGAGLAAYLFWGVQTGSLIAASTEVPRAPIPVSREAIKTVLDAYQARASAYVAKTFAPVDLADPRPKKK